MCSSYHHTLFFFRYRDQRGRFRTIMSNDCPDSCPRILRFSTNDPEVTYNGQKVGDDEQNCVKQMNSAVPKISRFMVRTPFPTTAPIMECQDSPNHQKFQMGKKRRSCKWMTQRGFRVTKFCKEKHIQLGCPKSCYQC